MSERNLILVVDDDVDVASELKNHLELKGARAIVVHSGEAALVELDRSPVDLVLSDVRMPGMSGVELLRTLRSRRLDIPVVLISAPASDAMTTEAIREGAADFLQKPWDLKQLWFSVRKALALGGAVRHAPPRVQLDLPADGMVGTSAALTQARTHLGRAAQTDARVLILGETGTGKELAARALHSQSRRAGKPFVAVNCAAFTKELFLAEIFGTVKGAFNDAQDKPGRVGIAEGGTLFLDEVGDLGADAQVQMLRFLEQGTYERVGSNQTRRADVRVIAATNQPLERMADEGKFRRDLLERLNVVSVELPPLRERPEDIEPLAKYFVALIGKRLGRPAASLTEAALRTLAVQSWERGNVRQLHNFLEGLLVLSERDSLDEPEVKAELLRRAGRVDEAKAPGPPPPLGEAVRQAEKAAIEAALRYSKGRRDVAAIVLDVSRRSLQYKIAEYGIG